MAVSLKASSALVAPRSVIRAAATSVMISLTSDASMERRKREGYF